MRREKTECIKAKYVVKLTTTLGKDQKYMANSNASS